MPANEQAPLLPPVVAVGTYLVLCAALFLGIFYATNGHFTFALDDPYIHLALAEQIAHGHYGINPGEAASPSSSVLWPLLLAPFSRFAWQVNAVLGLNLLAGLTGAVLLGIAILRWPGWNRSLDEITRRTVSAVLLVIAANLVGLTFIGMEHTLQVTLAIACAFGVIACLRGRPIPMWCLVAAAVGPCIRYESVGLTVALGVALWGQRKRAQAGVLLAVAVLPLMVFSAFLQHLGLPLLPTSVLLKGGVLGSERAATGAEYLTGAAQAMVAHAKALARVAYYMRRSNHYTADNRVLVFVLFATLAGLAFAEKERVRRYALTGAAVSAGLHVLTGRFGSSYRYDVYILVFSLLVILHVVHERPRFLLGWYVLGLMACAWPYVPAIRDTVSSAQEVYLQQNQMHRFATDFYTGNVAVNDLGLVSYRKLPNQRVLDLAGLGSVESARQKNKSAEWLDAVTKAHSVGVVMLYHDWYPKIPASWAHLGQICLLRDPIAVGGRCVQFYATGHEPVAPIQQSFARFVHTLPRGAATTPDPASTVE